MHIWCGKGQTHSGFIATLVYWSLARQTTLTKCSVSILKLELSYRKDGKSGTGFFCKIRPGSISVDDDGDTV